MENLKMVNSRRQSQALHGFRNRRKRLSTELECRSFEKHCCIKYKSTNAQYTTMVGPCFAFWWIGHFRVPKTPHFQNEVKCTTYLRKRVLCAWEWKITSISEAEHLTSCWYRGSGELRSGLLTFVVVFQVKQRVVTLLNQHGGSMKDIRAVMRGQSCETCASISCQAKNTKVH